LLPSQKQCQIVRVRLPHFKNTLSQSFSTLSHCHIHFWHCHIVTFIFDIVTFIFDICFHFSFNDPIGPKRVFLYRRKFYFIEILFYRKLPFFEATRRFATRVKLRCFKVWRNLWTNQKLMTYSDASPRYFKARIILKKDMISPIIFPQYFFISITQSKSAINNSLGTAGFVCLAYIMQ